MDDLIDKVISEGTTTMSKYMIEGAHSTRGWSTLLLQRRPGCALCAAPPALSVFWVDGDWLEHAVL